MIGAKGPRMLRVAARHADIWSWFVQERSDMGEFGPRLDAIVAACVDAGRDPATIGRSAGIVVEPTAVTGSEKEFGVPVRGSASEIADTFRAFQAGLHAARGHPLATDAGRAGRDAPGAGAPGGRLIQDDSHVHQVSAEDERARV